MGLEKADWPLVASKCLVMMGILSSQKHSHWATGPLGHLLDFWSVLENSTSAWNNSSKTPKQSYHPQHQREVQERTAHVEIPTMLSLQELNLQDL